jgi:hypothetical protein
MHKMNGNHCLGLYHDSTVCRLLVVAAAVMILFAAVASAAQVRHSGAGSEEEEEIDRAVRAAIIDSIIVTLDRVYVFPDVAEKIEKHLRKNFKGKKYGKFNTVESFTERLTRDIQEISGDKHLWVRRADEEQIRESRIEKPTDDDIRRRIERQERYNFGFEKVEHLPWNIGYLKFNSFADATYAGRTAIAAMNFLSFCDAIIIDVRDNGGGSPSMVQLITSYFLEESTHLNSFYIRRDDSMRQFWSHAYVEGKLLDDVPLFVLTSSRTFSAAEEFTYNLKNLERATIVGETTGGGAHPTSRAIFAELKVIMSCPFGRAVNPITGTNWEGTGIEPHIAVPSDEALDVAKLEAIKIMRERTDDDRIRDGLEFAIKRLQAIREPAEIDPERLERYAGVYGPRRIIVEDGMPFYEREGRPKYRMIPINDTLFCFADIEYFLLEVELDDSGNPIALVGIYDNGQTDRSPRNIE